MNVTLRIYDNLVEEPDAVLVFLRFGNLAIALSGDRLEEVWAEEHRFVGYELYYEVYEVAPMWWDYAQEVWGLSPYQVG